MAKWLQEGYKLAIQMKNEKVESTDRSNHQECVHGWFKVYGGHVGLIFYYLT